MPIHPLLARELRQSKRLRKFFDSLPESSRHQIDREVREVKKEATRLLPRATLGSPLSPVCSGITGQP